MRATTIAAVVILLASGLVRASDTPTVRDVLAAQEQLSEAVLARDAEALEQLLSKDLVVNAPGNRIRHREDLISLFASGEVAYRSMTTKIDYAGELDGLVVIMGTESTVLETAPQESPWAAGTTLHRRFTNVYRNENGHWRLIIKQSTVFSVE